MNFQNHYFKEEQIEEKIGDVVSDVAGASAGTVAKAAAKGVGRAALNVLKGITGRTKTMAFEPNWLKVLKPIDQETYKKTISQYANWKAKKTTLGPKKSFTIKDLRDGVLGDFSGDDFVKILSNYDNSMENIDMEADIPPQISIYLLNNGGKIIFMNLPIDKNGKKRKFAMGLDSKGERAFRLIHGMTFQDYDLVNAEKDPRQSNKEVKKNPFPYRYQIDKNVFDKIAPEINAKFKESNNSFSLFNLFNEEIFEEKVKYVFKKDGKWFSASSSKGSPFEYTEFDPNDIYVAVKTNDPVGSVKKAEKLEKDEDLQKEVDDKIKSAETSKEEPENKNPEENKEKFDKYDIKELGELYVDVYEELDGEPVKIKPTDKIQYGWKYIFKNGGRIFIYETKDGKHMIAFDIKGKEMTDKFKLIKKYNLEQDNPEDYPEEA